MKTAGSKRKRAKAIRGLREDAKFLGVNHDHLRWVIQGKRPGKSLLARYMQLKASLAAASTPTPNPSIR